VTWMQDQPRGSDGPNAAARNEIYPLP